MPTSMIPNSADKPVSLAFDHGTLLLYGVDPEEMSSMFSPGLWAWDSRVAAWRCEAIHYRDILATLQRGVGGRLRDDVPCPPAVKWGEIDLPALRPEQQHALTAWKGEPSPAS